MIPELAAAIDAGEPVVLATVVRTSRSVPRRSGSKMLVFADGHTEGTIGGGEMEHRVTVEAEAALADGKPRLIEYQLVDPTEGDPGVCGGEAEIYLEPFMPQPTLLIIGAGHVGQAVLNLASLLDFRTVIWDDRAELVDDLDPTGASTTHLASSEPLAKLLDTLDLTQESAVVMVTRNVTLDVDILPKLLATPARYIGVMGSARRWQTTRKLLVEAGTASADLDRVRSPIGVEIAAETPAEIAVSIMAEVIAERRGA